MWFHEPHKPIATDIKFSDLYKGQSKRDATYFGNISQLDFALGKVMDALDAEGVADNTLIIFSSDNGPVISEGGSTGGLRGLKRSDFEGGIRVPFLARWPGHIEAGSVSDIPVVGTDIFATVLEIVGIPVPDDRTIDSVSLLPVFAGKPVERPIPLFWRTHVSPAEDRVAMRIGDWKIVSDDTMTRFQLFNVQQDWQEKNNLAEKMSDKTEEMKQVLFQTWQNIVEEGPNEWWEMEKNKPMKGAKIPY